MLKKAAWLAIAFLIASMFVIPHSATNITLAFFTLWVLSDGILVAIDLKASETRIKELETQLRTNTKTHDISTSELIKKTDDNHHLMMELRTRLILVQQNVNKNNHRTHTPHLRPSNSLD